MFKCSICKKIFDRKYNYDRHITSKNNCVYKEDDNELNDDEQNKINLECEHCKKHTQQNLILINISRNVVFYQRKMRSLNRKNYFIKRESPIWKIRFLN